MAKTTTTLNITGRNLESFNDPATVSVSTGWLHLILWADTLIHRHPLPGVEERCALDVYLLTADRESGAGPQNYCHCGISCLPAQAVQFGRSLEVECREALHLRRELGLMAPADDYIDD